MPLEWFLIPVVTGYWFLTHLHFTRYGALRDSGYHVFFRAVIAGVILAFIAYTSIFLLNPHIPEVSTIWESFMPIPYSGMLTLTILLGWALPIVGNLFYSKEKAARRAARQSGDLIELLIVESIEEQRLIELSLKNGKSYIGFALESGITSQDESDISLIPMVSGYRNRNTQELEITTNYAPVVQKSLKETLDLAYEDFRVVIPMPEIVSARLFHPETYERFKGDAQVQRQRILGE